MTVSLFDYIHSLSTSEVLFSIFNTLYLLILKDILVNSRKDAQIRDPSTGFYMELDFYIPSKKISFEFQVCYLLSSFPRSFLPSCLFILFLPLFLQDSYHYATSWYVNKTIDAVRQRDSIPLIPFHLFFSFYSLLVSLSYLFFVLIRFDSQLDLKHDMVSERGETMIQVPCWWDGSSARFHPSLPTPPYLLYPLFCLITSQNSLLYFIYFIC